MLKQQLRHYKIFRHNPTIMQLNELQPKTKRQTKKRVGRGGLRGKTSGRGMKGQTARAGHSLRPEMRDIIKKLPKLRGHGKNRGRTVNSSVVKPTPVNLSTINALYKSGEQVTPETLHTHGVITQAGGRLPVVKILAKGEISKKVSVSKCLFSEAAKVAIEKAGGSIA
ncbi:MAG: 50S ribosomal protein L15 [Candidatus Pacebacteria bacterium]|nr:50S ribosomal protein L15 [Candidatus Paceibacterota bacterium]